MLVSGIAFTDFETPGAPESSPRNLGAIWAQNSLPGGAKSTIVGSKGNRINGTYDMMYGFDSHTSPPYLLKIQAVTSARGSIKGEACGFLAHKPAAANPFHLFRMPRTKAKAASEYDPSQLKAIPPGSGVPAFCLIPLDAATDESRVVHSPCWRSCMIARYAELSYQAFASSIDGNSTTAAPSTESPSSCSKGVYAATLLRSQAQNGRRLPDRYIRNMQA